jgi:hypothetical protein
MSDVDEQSQDDQPFSREGTPWGSPAGAIKRWIRRYRHNGTHDSASSDSTE